MFKRLFVLLLLLAATIVVSPPAHASTLTINSLYCERLDSPYYNRGYYGCDAGVTGGVPGYTYTWNVSSSWESSYSFTTTTPSMRRTCAWNPYTGAASVRVHLVVTDSVGATAGAVRFFICEGGTLD